MLENALISILTLGWLDLINPVAVSFILILLPLVRRKSHLLYYIFGAYAAYVAGAFAVFIGVDRYLLGLLETLRQQHARQYGIALMILGDAAMIGCILMVVSFIRAARQNREVSFEMVVHIKSANPLLIVLIAFGVTWGGLFTSYAILAYIGVLVINNISTADAIWLLALFAIFSAIPGFTVYWLILHVKGERFRRIIGIIQKVMNRFCLFSMPVVLAVLAVMFFANAAKCLGH